MSILVTDTGFGGDDWAFGFHAPDMLAANAPHDAGLDLGPDANLQEIAAQLAEIPMIRIAFPSFADGRGFTLARQLRDMGFSGRLRAFGHILSDQYAMARRSGFDEVEISDELAQRQPEPEWLFRANWQAHDYRSRLAG